MARVRKVDRILITVQNVIDQLTEIPIDDIVMVTAAGAPAIIEDEYTVSGKTITWNVIGAGYDLDSGDVVVACYEYDNGLGADITPYDGSDPTMNPNLLQYILTVIEEGIMPKLIHVPVASTLVMSVDGSAIILGVHWTRNGKILTWISGTTLSVGAIISVEYRVL